MADKRFLAVKAGMWSKGGKLQVYVVAMTTANVYVAMCYWHPYIVESVRQVAMASARVFCFHSYLWSWRPSLRLITHSEMQESGCDQDDFTYRVLLRGYLLKNRYDDVAMLLHSMDGSGYYLDPVTTTLLRDAIASGSLDTTMSILIGKLARKQEMDIPRIAA
ncbi:putative pentatricopeptide repeat-containing protein [Tanacetum coccineum]